MTEQELVSRFRAGEQSAFNTLVQTYQTAIYNLCYRMLGDTGLAEDATQETFVRAYTRFHRYDAERSLKTWLLSIASHYCIDCLRKRRATLVDIDDEPLAGHPALREGGLGPEEFALRHEKCAGIRGLLDELGPKDRAAIVMLYWHDFSYQEIADATGSTVSAVKSRLHRARGVMAEALRASSVDKGVRQANFQSLHPGAQPAIAGA